MWIEQKPFKYSFISRGYAVEVEFSQLSHSDHLLFFMKRIWEGVLTPELER